MGVQLFLIKSSTHCRLLQTGHFQLPSTARALRTSGIELAREVPGTPRAHSTACFGAKGEGQKALISSSFSSVLLLLRLPTLGAGSWLSSSMCPAPPCWVTLCHFPCAVPLEKGNPAGDTCCDNMGLPLRTRQGPRACCEDALWGHLEVVEGRS